MHPYLRTPFGLLSTYTVFVALGYASAAFVTWYRHRHKGFHFETIFSLSLLAAVTSVIGSRAWYVATHPSLYAPWFRAFPKAGMDIDIGIGAGAGAFVILVLYARQFFRSWKPVQIALVFACVASAVGLLAARVAALRGSAPADPFDVSGGGLAFFGGLATASLACALYARRLGLPLPEAADAVAPGILIAASVGRFGCYFNGCCGGVRTASGAIVPVPLIESALTAATAVLLIARPLAPAGRTAAASALAYASVRFTLDFFRADVATFALGLTPSQAAALVLAAVAAASLLHRPAPQPEPASP